VKENSDFDLFGVNYIITKISLLILGFGNHAVKKLSMIAKSHFLSFLRKIIIGLAKNTSLKYVY
jgi:hypothetical protein